MSKKTKLIPELRFPEFSDEGEWEEKELNSLGELINGLTYSPNDVRGKGLLVLRSSNIQNGLIALNDCVYVRTDIKGANFSEPNDILICIRNGSKSLIGKNAIIPKGIPFATHGAFMTVFRAEKPEFVFQLFQTERYEKQVKADLGATINSINSKNFLKYKFIVPKNPEEQQKIASCLSSLDEMIAAQGQKLDLLKDHKKGLMQKLFPHDGKKVPKYRFKEFINDGEWKERTLQSVSELIMGSSPSSSSYNEKKIGLPLLQGNADIKNRLSTPRIYTSVVTKECEVGDILLSVRAPVGTVAKSLHKACIGRGISALRAIKPNSQEYLYQWLFSYESSWKNISQGGTFDAVNSNDIRNLLLLIPKPKEQQKIASCLSSLDALITAQTEKIEQLKLHKKGLMQGLFPKMND